LRCVDSEKPTDRDFDPNSAKIGRALGIFNDINENSNQERYTRKKIRQKIMNIHHRKQAKTQTLPSLKSLNQTKSKALSANELHQQSERDAARHESLETKEKKSFRRNKRHLSLPRNVEVMVTADNGMVNLHEDLEHYVLTLMAIVS